MTLLALCVGLGYGLTPIGKHLVDRPGGIAFAAA
jgi:hypothetical protein